MSEAEKKNAEKQLYDKVIQNKFDAHRMSISEGNINLEFGEKDNGDYRVAARYVFSREEFLSLLLSSLEILKILQDEGQGFESIKVKENDEKRSDEK